MKFKKRKSKPYAVKVKLQRHKGYYTVREVYGTGWKTLMVSKSENQALDYLAGQLNNKDLQWSRETKMRGGWVCRNCGELDLELLESHHIKPRCLYPEAALDADNGECICMWRHALLHRDSPISMNLILLRLVKLLTGRLYKLQTKCQKELFAYEQRQ